MKENRAARYRKKDYCMLRKTIVKNCQNTAAKTKTKTTAWQEDCGWRQTIVKNCQNKTQNSNIKRKAWQERNARTSHVAIHGPQPTNLPPGCCQSSPPGYNAVTSVTTVTLTGWCRAGFLLDGWRRTFVDWLDDVLDDVDDVWLTIFFTVCTNFNFYSTGTRNSKCKIMSRKRFPVKRSFIN